MAINTMKRYGVKIVIHESVWGKDLLLDRIRYYKAATPEAAAQKARKSLEWGPYGQGGTRCHHPEMMSDENLYFVVKEVGAAKPAKVWSFEQKDF